MFKVDLQKPSRKRRYESSAKKSSPVMSCSAGNVSGVTPTFSIVSIIPGMDTLAPDLTARSNGFSGQPNCLPVSLSNLAIALSIVLMKFSVA